MKWIFKIIKCNWFHTLYQNPNKKDHWYCPRCKMEYPMKPSDNDPIYPWIQSRSKLSGKTGPA